MKKIGTIIIKIEPDIKKKLKTMADKDRRTLSSFVRMILDKVVSGEIKP